MIEHFNSAKPTLSPWSFCKNLLRPIAFSKNRRKNNSGKIPWGNFPENQSRSHNWVELMPSTKKIQKIWFFTKIIHLKEGKILNGFCYHLDTQGAPGLTSKYRPETLSAYRFCAMKLVISTLWNIYLIWNHWYTLFYQLFTFLQKRTSHFFNRIAFYRS